MSSVALITTPDDGSCGIGTYTGSLVAELDADVECHFLTLGSLNPFEYLGAALTATRSDADVIHVQHEYGIYGPKSLLSWVFFPVLAVLAATAGKPVIVTFHSAWNAETIGPPLAPVKRIYVRLNNRLLAAVADHALFLSENCRDLFLDSVALDSYEVLPHGVQAGETVELDAVDAREVFDLNVDDVVIAEPGYLRHEKGSDIFVDLAEELPEYKFLLAGGSQAGDDYRADLESRAPDNLQITGQLSEDKFHAAFNAADLVVLPYREVTQSGIFNWCVAYEVPVAASDVDYFRYIDDEAGCLELFDHTSTGAIAATVSDLVEGDRLDVLAERMAAYSDSRTMGEVADRHTDIYAEYAE